MNDSWFKDRQWKMLVLCSALLLALMVSAPQWFHMLDERYEGIPVHLNSDEYSYMPRLQEALNLQGDRIGVSVGGGEKTAELQEGLVERLYGFIFRPTGLSAATVLTIMDFVAPLLFFLVLIGFLRSVGLSRKRAFLAACLFCLLELYNLGRPIHQRVSFLLTLLAMWGIVEGLERRMLWGILGGLLMGLLVGVYFWSFTAVWGWWLLLLLYELGLWGIYKWKQKHVPKQSVLKNFLERFKFKKKPKEEPSHRWESLLIFGGYGFLAAIPFIWRSIVTSRHPVYEEVFFRSGIGSSHIPESWPWTFLFAMMAVSIVILWGKNRKNPDTYLVCTVVTAFVILNQHLIHGTLFLFASHYLFFLVFAGVLALVFAWPEKWRELRSWTQATIVCILAATVFLGGIGWDNRSVIKQWRVDAGSFEEQYFVTAIPVLEGIPQTMILTDPDTSNSIASHTAHDVLFTRYIMHEMKTHHEIAQRYCLTVLPFSKERRSAYDHRHPVFGAAYDSAYTEEAKTSLQREELQLIEETCATVWVYMRETLDKYGVEYVFWNEKNQPDWVPEELGVPLELIAKDEGWSLWQIN